MRNLLAIVALCAVAVCAHADLTLAQRTTLHADIVADPVLGQLPPSSDSVNQIIAAYAAPPAVACVVWRSAVPEKDITDLTSSTGTTWSWTAYIARSQAERDAWVLMLGAERTINPSLLQVRNAVSDIFSGTSAAAIAQRAHLNAIAQRGANRLEKLFANGSCTSASPSAMAVEGALDYSTVLRAMGW